MTIHPLVRNNATLTTEKSNNILGCLEFQFEHEPSNTTPATE